MKPFLKNIIEFYNNEMKGIDNCKLKKFTEDNDLKFLSFDTKIKEFEKGIENLIFDSSNSIVVKATKKHNTIEIKCPFFKKNNENELQTEIGSAIIILTLSNFSKNFKSIKDNDIEICGIFFENGLIGCIYNEKDKLDYFIEKNTVEVSVIKSVEIDFENYKNIIQ